MIELVIKGLFSLIGVIGRDRGVFIDEKKMIRKLYTAVKEVAIRVIIRAHEFRLEVFIDSIIASLEKNPERYGVPVSARLPMVRQVVVIGSIFCRPPIFRMSCSSFKLWIIEPEHRNSIALKKACVQIWKKASCG